MPEELTNAATELNLDTQLELRYTQQIEHIVRPKHAAELVCDWECREFGSNNCIP
jgi:hypothetical protein